MDFLEEHCQFQLDKKGNYLRGPFLARIEFILQLRDNEIVVDKIPSKHSDINCRQLNWDTVSQPVNDLFESETQPNLPVNCPFSEKILSRIQLIQLTNIIIIIIDLLSCLREYFELFGAKKCWFDDMTIFFARLVESEITEVTHETYLT